MTDAELDRIKKDVLEIQEWNRVQKICCDGSVEKYSYDPEAYQQIDRLLTHIQHIIQLWEEAGLTDGQGIAQNVRHGRE